MKIFILLSRLSRGGVEMRTLQMLEYFARSAGERPDFYVYITSGEGGALAARYEACSTLIYRDKANSILVDFVKNIRAVGPDVLFINANLAGGVYCLAARLFGFKTAYSRITTASDYSNSLWYRLKKPVFRYLTNQFSSRVIGVCEAAQKLTATPDSKWITVYDGFDGAENHLVRQDDDNALRLVMVGRLHPLKNHDYAIKVVNKLRQKTAVTLDIYGQGDADYTESLRSKIAGYGLENTVRLRGDTSDPIAAIAENDVLLLPSTREGLPGVVIEALSAGRPVVCADLPGCIEISRHSSHVTCLSLAENLIEQWGDAALSAKQNGDDAVIRREFSASPFSIRAHSEALYAIWQGRTPESVQP